MLEITKDLLSLYIERRETERKRDSLNDRNLQRKWLSDVLVCIRRRCEIT